MNHDIFRDFINWHEWTFVKTYAAFCPHEYIVMKKLPREEWPLFPEIAKYIREKGFMAEYGRLGPNWYYIVDDYYYWAMNKNVEDTDLINRAKLSDYLFVHKGNGSVICRRNKQKRFKELDLELLIAKVNQQTKDRQENVGIIWDAGDCYYVASYIWGVQPPMHPPYVVDEDGNIEGFLFKWYYPYGNDPFSGKPVIYKNVFGKIWSGEFGNEAIRAACELREKMESRKCNV